MKMESRFFLVVLLVFTVLFLVTNIQTSASGNPSWHTTTLKALELNTGKKPLIQTNGGAYFTADFQQIYNDVLEHGAGYIIQLPVQNAVFENFELMEITTMSEGLKAEFPEIKSYTLISIENPGTWGKFDISPKGIFAMFKSAGQETIFIDPLFDSDTESYVLYTRSEYIVTKTAVCLVEGTASKYTSDDLEKSATSEAYNTCDLRTYRLAVAVTGEYTQFHGGTTDLAMAAVVTTINRVNMIYERDFAVTLQLVPNNSLLLFEDPETDPFTNGNAGAMIQEIPGVINSAIGINNYDIGHVFGTNSGGLAGLGVVCGSQKARGVTGSGAPIGDAFDIDYVAHEMGHQFGANHTYNNSCQGNRNNSTAVEPGSGSTILAYAGICSPNVQSNSDDYFHGVSMLEIGTRINTHLCAAKTSLNNVSPEILTLPTNIYVPVSTPFALTVEADDENEMDVLTYAWEQMDNEISTQPPVASALTGPNFRSYKPDTLPTRFFPSLPDLAISPNQTWERLPSVARTMQFRVSVRDNAPGGGCTQYDNTTVNFVASAGPLEVTYPNITSIVWNAFTNETVTWNVANTDQEPIGCEFVNIYLSVDGGTSYPILLASNVPNNGSATIEVPNYITTSARVMVMSDQGTFFDISNNNFIINGITNGFYLQTDQTAQNGCVGDEIVYTINAFSVGDFAEAIHLSFEQEPVGLTATFQSTTLMPGESTTLTLSNTEDAPIGILDIIVKGVSDSAEGILVLQAGFNVVDAISPTLISPENNAEYVAADVTFIWSEAESPDAVYQFQLALDSNFINIVADVSDLTQNTFAVLGLVSETSYYWRVRKSTECGVSEYSEPFSFFTHTCFDFDATDLPQTIPASVSTTISSIEVLSSGLLTDVNILNIFGNHNRLSDLKFEIRSPQGTSVVLANNICDDASNFDLGFDDAVSIGEVDCPPSNGTMYVPAEALSAFNGEDSQGIWELRIYDQVSGAGGTLTDWTLQLCIAGGSSFLLTTDNPEMEICRDTEVTFEVTAIPVFEFYDDILLSASGLPEGVAISFDPETIHPGETSVVTMDISSDSDLDVYSWTINGLAEDVALYALPLELSINESDPLPVQLAFPQNNIAVTSAIVTFQWERSSSPSAEYEFEIAYDSEFSDMVGNYDIQPDTSYTLAGLPANDTLYWRVGIDNGCGETLSEVYTVITAPCYYEESEDLPINISSSTGSYPSEINIPFSGVLTRVAVVGLSGTHNRVADLSARLISPSGTVVELFAQVCGSNSDFNLSFADGGLEEIDCPPTTGLVYQPTESLSAFIGENGMGIWTLELEDSQPGAGGTFDQWALEVCMEETTGYPGANLYDIGIFPNPTSGGLNLNLGSGSGIELLQLVDLSGRVLKRLEVNGSEYVYMDLSAYASGIYFIRVSGLKGSSSFKLIKQ